MSKKISVVVPIYNVEAFLPRCIDSILNQTYKNLEVILVDDESPDRCGEICEEYRKKDNRIIVIHQKNKGLSGARNAGIDIATGEYIGFVDSDDYIEPDMYEKLYKQNEENGSQIAICGRYYEFENGEKLIRYKEEAKTSVMSNIDAIKRMNSFNSFDMAAWDKLYKLDIFDNIRYPQGKLSEDYFVIYKLFEKAEKISFNPQPLYHYMQRQNSISRNKKINFDFIEASKSQMDYLEPKYPELENVLHSAYASANMTVYNFHIKNKVKCQKEKKKELQMAVREQLRYIEENPNLPRIKKVQAKLFVYSLPIYNASFSALRAVKKI